MSSRSTAATSRAGAVFVLVALLGTAAGCSSRHGASPTDTTAKFDAATFDGTATLGQ